MTVFRGTVMTKLNNETPTPEPGSINGEVKVFNEEYVIAGTETTSDTIEVCKLPKGARFLYGVIQTSVSQGTSTLALGITGTTGKYRAAAVLTSILPEVFGTNEGDVLTAEETIFITIAVATLTAANLRVKIFYTLD
jgi:hypothetical protein